MQATTVLVESIVKVVFAHPVKRGTAVIRPTKLSVLQEHINQIKVKIFVVNAILERIKAQQDKALAQPALLELSQVVVPVAASSPKT